MATRHKIKMAVWKLTSCDGCQLCLLNLEDQLLDLTEIIEFAYFPEGFGNVIKGPYDISLVEGSVTTPHDEQRLHRLRRMSRLVIAIGACATAGGIQALRNFQNAQEWMRMVYPHSEFIQTLSKSTPLADHIRVDYELRGCPINPRQLMEVISACIQGRKPHLPSYSLCMECKRKGYVCVTVARGIACMGPVTQAGCGALCPACGRGCYGCFGPGDTANPSVLSQVWRQRLQMSAAEIKLAWQGINASAEPFCSEGQRHDR